MGARKSPARPNRRPPGRPGAAAAHSDATIRSAGATSIRSLGGRCVAAGWVTAGATFGAVPFALGARSGRPVRMPGERPLPTVTAGEVTGGAAPTGLAPPPPGTGRAGTFGTAGVGARVAGVT